MVENSMNSGIYQIINKRNYHMYIGSTINIKKRWRDHKDALRKNMHSNIHLQRAWNKDGEDLFEFSMIEYVGDLNTLETREQWFTDLWGPEYAICKKCVGNRRGTKHSKKTIKTMRESMSGKNNPMYGTSHSEETKQKMRVAKIGKNNPNFGKATWMKNKTHSEETKRKMSEAIIKHWINHRNNGVKTSDEP